MLIRRLNVGCQASETPADDIQVMDKGIQLANMPGWLHSLIASGNRVEGGPLSISGMLVSKNEVLSDGPFIESKEAILGFNDMIPGFSTIR
jgi:hypothetical protein